MPGIYDTNNGYYQFVDKAKAFACSVYNNVPGALVPNPSDAGYKQIWDNLCYTPPPAETPNLPPPPVSPFEGGQCCDSYYDIFGFVFFPGSPNSGIERRLGNSLLGKVAGIVSYIDTTGSGQTLFDLKMIRCNGTSYQKNLLSIANPSDAGVRISRVVLISGSDNCGDPPKEFPPAPAPPPEGYNSPPTVIVQNDGDVNYYIFNFFPPQKEDYPDTSFPPITISGAGQDNSSYLEMKFNFDGSVDIDKPPLPEVKLPESIQKKIDDTNSIVGGGGALEIKQIFDVDPTVKKRNTGSISEVEEDESGLLGIKVTLTNIPDKTHFGAPSVYFAGWITFKLQNGYAPRQQINFIESFFLAPPGATGYGCTFTNKAEGTVKVYSREAK